MKKGLKKKGGKVEGKRRKESKKYKLEALKYKSRIYSIREGIFSSGRVSFGDRYISPFAVAINASNSAVALLSSIGGLLGPLGQLFGSKLMEKHSRKKIVLKAIFLESLMWMPLIFLALLFYKGIALELLPIVLLISFGVFSLVANTIVPPWFSWIGDLVNEKYRGRWFSKRTLLMGISGVIFTLIGALFLDYMENSNLLMYGFGALFALAFIFRLAAWNTLRKQYEPKLKLDKEDHFSFFSFLIKAPKTNFGRFTLFRAAISFGGTVSAALFAVYLLRYLEFSYLTYMAIILSEMVFLIVFVELWGKIADKYGNYVVLFLTTMIIPLTPILKILSPSPFYIIFVAMLINGTVWSGFFLACGNFIYDNVSKEKRGLAVSYYNIIRGLGVFLGAGLGALLIEYLKIDFMEPLLFIFLLSSAILMSVVFFFIPTIKEVKKKEKVSGTGLRKFLFHHVGPTLMDEAHQIVSMKKYLRG